MDITQATTSIEVVFEHQDFIVINKPADIGFHFEGDQPGVAELAQAAWGAKLWPVHRLDKLTSGLLIFARSAQAAQLFQTLFKEHQLAKLYLAIAQNKPKKKQGEIRGDMSKGRNGSWRLLRSHDNPAITRFYSYAVEPGERLYLLRPYSGKTHQIRVALKSLGVPLLGDTRYGGIKADRGYLHAWGLSFLWKGEQIQVLQSPSYGERFLTNGCQEVLQTISPPWSLPFPEKL